RGGDLAARAREVGDRFRAALARAMTETKKDAKVRGRGLMIGIELADARAALAASRALLADGFVVLTGGVRGDTLTLSPALTVSEAQLEAFAVALLRLATSV